MDLTSLRYEISGSFSLKDFFIYVNLDTKAQRDADEILKLIFGDKKNLPLFLHEFTHFLESVTTPNGLRLYQCVQQVDDAELILIQKAAEMNNGEIRIPLNKWIIENLDMGIFPEDIWKQYLLALLIQLYHYGRSIYDANLVPCSLWDWSRNVTLRLDSHVRIEYNSIIRPCYSLFVSDGSGKLSRYHLGSFILREGIAKIIELAYVWKLFGETAFRKQYQAELDDPTMLPYYIAWTIFHHFIDNKRLATFETFLILAEASLLYDFYVCNIGAHRFSPWEISLLEDTDINPFVVFNDLIIRINKDPRFKKCAAPTTPQQLENFWKNVMEMSQTLYPHAFFCDLSNSLEFANKWIEEPYFRSCFERGLNLRKKMRDRSIFASLFDQEFFVRAYWELGPTIFGNDFAYAFHGFDEGQSTHSLQLHNIISDILNSSEVRCKIHSDYKKTCWSSDKCSWFTYSRLAECPKPCSFHRQINYVIEEIGARQIVPLG